MFTEQLHRNYDIGIAGQYVSCNSMYLFKDGLRSGYSGGDSEDLRIFHLNCQGLNSSFNFLSEICELSIFQVIGLTETLLNEHNSALLDIPGYTVYYRNRQFRQHGGIGAYIRSDIEVSVKSDLVLFHKMLFEPLILQLRLKPKDVYVVVLYRPPSGSIPAFMDIFEEQLDKPPIGSHPFFMLGDFHIDLNDMNSNIPMDFLQLCMSYCLFPTINICTCVTTLTAKLLDNILSNSNFQTQGLLLLMFLTILGFPQVLKFVSRGSKALD